MELNLYPIALALVLASVAPEAAHAETAPQPRSTALSDAVASPPTPTVLRGSPPVPIGPSGYTLAPPGYGCVASSSGDYADGWPDYDDWPAYAYYSGPDYGRGYRGFPRRGFGASHGPAGFHGLTGFHGFGAAVGPMGGFGPR